jgi:hypothetical protein
MSRDRNVHISLRILLVSDPGSCAATVGHRCGQEDSPVLLCHSYFQLKRTSNLRHIDPVIAASVSVI